MINLTAVKGLPKLLKTLWVGWFYFTFSMLFIIYLIPFLLLMKWKRSYRFLHSLRRLFLKLQLPLAGVIIRKRIEGKLPQPGAIFCFNHSSMLDILIPIAAMNRQIRFVGKSELMKIPLFGIVFRTLDIPIDRESALKSYDALGGAVKMLHSGIDIFIAPEGTTSIKAPQLLPFRNGAFWLAEQAEVPIVPVVFLDNWRLFHYDRKFDGRPGIYRMTMSEPVPAASAEELKVHIRMVMERLLQQLNP